MIRARMAAAVSILTIALGLSAWLTPARGAPGDGEVIFIDGCAPNKVQVGDECVFVEDLFRYGGPAGSEPIPSWGLVIHVPSGSGGSGTGGSQPTEQSCSDQYEDCVNASWAAFDNCEEVGTQRADYMLAFTGFGPDHPNYDELRENMLAGLRSVCQDDMEWDRKQCKTWEKACLKEARRR